jgi:hypothetical protein
LQHLFVLELAALGAAAAILFSLLVYKSSERVAGIGVAASAVGIAAVLMLPNRRPIGMRSGLVGGIESFLLLGSILLPLLGIAWVPRILRRRGASLLTASIAALGSSLVFSPSVIIAVLTIACAIRGDCV